MTGYVNIGGKPEPTLLQPKCLFLALLLMTVLLLFCSLPNDNSTCSNNITSINTTTLFGFNNYTELTNGHIPLIIAISHGGHRAPSHIPNRSLGDVILNDLNIQEIGRAVAEKLIPEFGGRNPYILINHLHRRKVDVDRPFELGAEGDQTFPGELSDSQMAWIDYHRFFRDTVNEIEERFGRGLVVDLHGHTHRENYIEIGYLLTEETLALPVHLLNTNTSIHASSSICSLFRRISDSITFTTLLRGEVTSLGGRLQSMGYKAVPSHGHHFPAPDERYLCGGYCVKTYGSNNGGKVDAIQLVLPRNLSLGKNLIRKFSTDLSNGLAWYLNEYYWGSIGRDQSDLRLF